MQSYIYRLAATSAQKLRAQKYGWMSLKPRQNPDMPCAERFEGRLVNVHCDPKSGLYKQRLGDFFAPQKVNSSTSSTSDWEYDTAVASVYFDRAKQLATIKQTVPLTTIMAQVGGTMGLYTQLTGWSFISLLHLVIIMVQASFTCAIYSKKRKLAAKRAN